MTKMTSKCHQNDVQWRSMDEAARQPFKDVETKETERFDAEMLAYNEPVRPHPSPSRPLGLTD